MKLTDPKFIPVCATRVKRGWWIVKAAHPKLVWFGHDPFEVITRAQVYLGRYAARNAK